MRKRILLTFTILMTCLFSSCGEDKVIDVKDYPLKNETVTEVLASNGFDLSTYSSFYDEEDETGITYTYFLDNFDESGNCTGEPSVYGILNLEWGGEDGKSVEMVCMYEDSRFADITNYDNLKKTVYVACDVYGNTENKKQIADDFITAVKEGSIFEDEESLPVWENEYNGVYVKAEFLYGIDGKPFVFRSFELYDESRKEWYDNSFERIMQMFVDMNP